MKTALGNKNSHFFSRFIESAPAIGNDAKAILQKGFLKKALRRQNLADHTLFLSSFEIKRVLVFPNKIDQ